MTKTNPVRDGRLEEVLRHLHPSPGFRPWHGGASVLGALRGVSAETAAWKPAPDRHSIWALTLHIAYWKYAVWRRITGEPKGGFERSPSNWPSVPNVQTAKAWDDDRALLKETHLKLVDAVAEFDVRHLDDRIDDDTATAYADVITGILLHDTYHVGQIQLLKRLWKSAAGA